MGPAGRLVLIAAAAVTDVVDGIWARRIGGSRAGVILDPVADKVFMATAFAVVWLGGALTSVEVLAVLLRDLAAAAGLLTTALLGRPIALPARAGGKAVTVGQVATLMAATLESSYARPLAWASAAIGLYAIADYGRIAWRRPRRR